jgi:hypothetical protein
MSYTETLFTVKAGYDTEFRFTVTDADGAAVDISAFSDFELIGKKRRSDALADAVFHLTQDAGDLTIASAATGLVDGTVPGADTADLDKRRYRLYTDFYGTIGGVTKALVTEIVVVDPSARHGA